MPGSDVDVVLAVLDAVERRDLERLDALYHPDVEFRWPPSLPYGGSFSGAEQVAEMAQRFGAIWIPLQPSPAERAMDPQVIATGDDGRVVVNYVWRGLDRQGRRFETETLGDYQVREGRLARAQMFYFDLAGLAAFLEGSGVMSGSIARAPDFEPTEGRPQ